jgi:hypothetical protein
MAENSVNLFRHNLIVNLFVFLNSGKKNPGHSMRSGVRFKNAGPRLHPFESALPIEPHVSDDQDAQEHEHAHKRIDRFQAETFLPGGK